MSVRSLDAIPVVPAPVRTAVLALGAQAGLALLYLVATDAGLAAPSILVVPFVWITASVVAVRHAKRPVEWRRLRADAVPLGALYAGGLAWLTGVVRHGHAAVFAADVVLLPPGWGPALSVATPALDATLVPFRVVGYAALAYLVALGVADLMASGRPSLRDAGSLVGVLSCAGCALPVLAGLAGGLLGSLGGGPAAYALGSPTYLLGTTAFVLAVALLSYRP